MQDIAVAGGLSLNLAARGGVSSFLPLQRELSQCVMGLEGVFWVKGHNCCLWLYLWMECQSGSSHSGRWSCPPSRLIVGIIQHERGKANVPGLRMSYSLTLELWTGFLATTVSITCLKVFRCLTAVCFLTDNLLHFIFSVGMVAFTLTISYAGELPRIMLPFLYALCLRFSPMENGNLAQFSVP